MLSALAAVINRDQMLHFSTVSQSTPESGVFESIHCPTALNKELRAACSGTKTDGRIIMRRNDPPRFMRYRADSQAQANDCTGKHEYIYIP